ncbi:MAG TPA: GH-E family nuclease [Microthrixaceae bacterium]|nr:GH-E family nuclease [Microthrixaceae bacterium]
MACTAVTAGAGTLGCAALAGAVAGGINGAFNNCSNGATANQCVLGIATGAALGAATDVAFLGAGHLIGGIGGTAVSRLLRTEAGEAITARITASPGIRQLLNATEHINDTWASRTPYRGQTGAISWGSEEAGLTPSAPASVADDVLTPRPRFRTGTVDDAWANATPGPNGGRLYPTCGDEVVVPPRSGPRDWDIDHQPPWSQRSGSLSKDPDLTRADVIDEYQRGTRLECPSCNRGRGARPL